MNNNPPPMTPTISPELQEKIEQEAIAKYPGIHNNIKGPANCHKYRKAFIAGATAYAPYKERFEQAKKALDRLKSVADCYSYIPSLNPPIKHLQSIINEALASWKEEGKGGNNG